MRLLNIKTLKLEWFHNADVAPSYAILSHRWEDEEVLFEDVNHRLMCSLIRSPDGWAKVLAFCKIAEQFGISYVWIDTCCIDKNSSTELSESLNSMFAWYRCATLCIAYLSDVSTDWGNKDSYRGLSRRHPKYRGHPRKSVWFNRGWTLQELIAPKDVWFYKRNWTFLGIRSELIDELHEITGVQKEILQRNGLEHLHTLSVAARMSWAANRETTRPEDLAYSLLGLFGVNMPILYGEGERNAFFRLQVMIFQSFSDHSIFAWKALSLPRVSRLVAVLSISTLTEA
ncbi:HET-domain-containing protein [Hyaloscypha bicolor E]|uniref:HET-domain-containing protein n=1 Tax=Hyaloscypha bicolor E TaxID=1095630 RepID=A0A2J6TUQ2_9HELO|nr:HET-domain-containing protein [Hyaloscypha bicolor E]PMD66736.1 HET-domain-containing protein [Hyaloscypha bicolor E]